MDDDDDDDVVVVVDDDDDQTRHLRPQAFFTVVTYSISVFN